MVILGYSESDEPIRAREQCYPLVWLILVSFIFVPSRGKNDGLSIHLTFDHTAEGQTKKNCNKVGKLSVLACHHLADCLENHESF